MRQRLPPGVEVKITYDQAELIGKAVANVRDAVLVGGLLTLIVLGLYLRSPRGTLAAAAALPSTMLMTSAVMHLAGSSMNLMSLGGLAVAIGLVVDDAVVVVEAVHRRVAAGMDSWSATAEALREIAWPVANSTFTTVVVFAPLSLLSGVAGQFFAALAFTLCAAVLISLLIALGVTPLMCGYLLAHGEEHHAREHPRYTRVLDWALQRPGRALAITGAVAVLFALVARGVGTGFLPELDERAFVVDYFTPIGTSLPEADRLAARIEQTVMKEEEVSITSRRLGAELGPPAATESSRGDITVALRSARHRTTQEVISDVRATVGAVAPGVRTEFIELLQDMLSDLEGNPEPVEVKLLGSDVNVLRDLGPKIAERLHDVKGLADLYSGVAGCAPEERLQVDPDAAGRLGLSARQVVDQVHAALLGEVVAQIPRANRLLGVRIRLDDSTRLRPDVLSRLRIRPEKGPPVALAAVAKFQNACAPSEIFSENLRPLVSVTGRLEGADLGTVTSQVESRLRKVEIPPGVDMVIGGQRESQRESFRALALVMWLAAFGVFCVLAFHFRSLLLPLLILAAVPLAIAAGVLSLRLTGTPLNVSSFMGCILLVGLVVKNGILLLDHAEAARRGGAEPRQAVRAAAQIRIRPILMTTLATLLGLIPLALGIGTGAELQRPLAIAVIGGLFFSTLAVLIALPPAYAAVARWRSNLRTNPGS
jgi:multidrug efflux pump subunit AcrB